MNFLQKMKLKGLRKKVEKAHDVAVQQGNKVNPQTEVTAQYELAQFYAKHRFDKGLPHAEDYELECYRAVSLLGDAKASYLCGKQLLEKAKFWDAWSRGPLYGAEIHQKYAKAFYDEAFVYLRTAEERGYALAKRLLGLVHIHGWGVAKNMDAGYQYILDSIEQEKAWERATKIFDELKLNSPEFFAALRNYQAK